MDFVLLEQGDVLQTTEHIDRLPVARAESIPVTRGEEISEPLLSTSCEPLVEPLCNDQPEYMHITIHKPTPDTSLGIYLQKRSGGGVLLKRFDAQSLLHGSCARPGHRILSINGVCTVRAQPSTVARFLAATPRVVNLVLHCPDGVGTACSITKTCTSAGLRLAQRAGRVVVSHVEPKGLLSDSLIQAGDVVLSVNDTPCVTATQAAADIRATTGYLTLYFRPMGAMVWAMVDRKKWWFVAAALAAAVGGAAAIQLE